MGSSDSLGAQLVVPGTGKAIYAFASKIFPICRSITGSGVRETLRLIGERINLDMHEVPTGTEVFDWTIPKEWNLYDAFIRDARGEKIVDFATSNLHVVSYSAPVHTRLPLSELKKHVHTLPKQPDLIPYRTSYYKEDWGFCMMHRQLKSLTDETYEVVIDFEPGGRRPHLCRAPAPGRNGGRDPPVGPHLPPLSCER